MNILDRLIEKARDLLSEESSLRVDNVILGKTLYTMKNCDKVFSDMNFSLVLLEDAYGFAYFQEEINYVIGKYVNKSIFDILKDDIPLYFKVALIDALYCLINKKRQQEHLHFSGNLREKAEARAKILLSYIPENSKVLLLGAVTEIIEESKQKNVNLKVLDLEPQKVGLQFSETKIESNISTNLLELIKNVDYILTTGMVFVTDTADYIFKIAKENNVKIIMYMESGSNFGRELIDMGAHVVLSEFFPYYDFYGDTKYFVFENNTNN